MDNILTFPEIDKIQHVKQIFPNEKFIVFYFDDDHGLCYMWGKNVTLMEMSYIQKTLDMLGVNEMNRAWGD